jgi:Tfp pilus assembly protein PilV
MADTRITFYTNNKASAMNARREASNKYEIEKKDITWTNFMLCCGNNKRVKNTKYKKRKKPVILATPMANYTE